MATQTPNIPDSKLAGALDVVVVTGHPDAYPVAVTGPLGANNANGQATMANSTPVVIASDQTAVPTTDGGSAFAILHGIAQVPFTSADQHSAADACTSAPTTGKKLVITDLIISVDTAMSVTLTEETSGTVVWGPHFFPANSGPVQNTPRGSIKLATANKRLMAETSVAGNVTVDVFYYSA